MKAIYTSALFFALLCSHFGLHAQASITYPIPQDALQMANVPHNVNQSNVWLCGSGGSLVQGNGNTIYMDRMGTLTVTGNNNVIYTKSNGVITISGNNNVLHACMCPSITVDGNNNQINTLAGMPVSINGNNDTRTNIAHLYFSYGTAPHGGQCVLTTGIASAVEDYGFSVYPNPARAGEKIVLPELEGKEPIILTDALGRALLTYPSGTTEITTIGMAPGVYSLHVQDGPSVQVMVQ